MVGITEKRLVSLIWILNNKSKSWSILQLQKEASALLQKKEPGVYKKGTRVKILDSKAALAYSPTFGLVKELEKKKFISKDSQTNEYSVTNATGLIDLISLNRPLNGLETVNYYSPLGLSKTLNLIADSRMDYAFTLFAGSEIYRAYVKTDQVHVYINKENEKEWKKYLISKGCRAAQQKKDANLFFIPLNEPLNTAVLAGASKIKGYSIAPAPILLSDLLSFGGLAEEQGRFLMDAWLENRL